MIDSDNDEYISYTQLIYILTQIDGIFDRYDVLNPILHEVCIYCIHFIHMYYVCVVGIYYILYNVYISKSMLINAYFTYIYSICIVYYRHAYTLLIIYILYITIYHIGNWGFRLLSDQRQY